MISSSRGAEREHAARLVREVEQRAFGSYLRHGRVPELYEKLAEASRDEKAFAEYCRSNLSLKALGEPRPTSFYTWRTMRDDRVRPTHAANEGRVFAWRDVPVTGHPGHAPNCRCKAEPYYGNPAIPDATLLIRRTRRIDTSGRALWASFETLTRPDGSLVRSAISMRDGTRIDSTFLGSRVTHDVRFHDSRAVRLDKRNGVQFLSVAGSRTPTLASEWTSEGPRIGVPRQRVAQLVPRPDGEPFDEIEVYEPFPATPLADIALGSVAALGLLALYNMLRAEQESLGAGSGDVAVVAFKVWTNGKERNASAVSVEALTAEQVAQSCKRLPDVQQWTNEAARALQPQRGNMSPQQWGTAVHRRIKDQIDALKKESSPTYRDVSAELSIDPEDPKAPTRYGQLSSTRLDVLEEIRSGLICVYDVKTGQSGLSLHRVAHIAKLVAARHPGAIFFIVEVRPFE